MQLEPNVFDRKHLLLREIDAYLHWLCVGYYRLVQHICLLLVNYTMLDVIKAKPQLVLHIVSGMELLLQGFASWSGSSMFAITNFCNAQSTCVGLQCPTIFG